MALSKRSNQILLNIPMNVNDMIKDEHIVRKILEDVESLDLSCLESEYSRIGRPGVVIENMFSMILYGYTQSIISTRALEKACQENITFMWLMEGKQPDHSTIHKFQTMIAKHESRIMQEQVKLLLKKGLIDLSTISIDGTKIKSRANKYTNVYRGTVGYHEKNMETKLIDLIVNAFEGTNGLTSDVEPTFDIPTAINDMITKPNPNNKNYTNNKSINRNYIARLSINDYIVLIQWLKTLTPAQIEGNSMVRTLHKEIDGFFLRKLKYERQRETLGERNSYSKTDTDASFMRMKDDSFDSKILSPGYNVQCASSNGFIVGMTVSNEVSDTRQLMNVVDKLEETNAILDTSIILADAGYGSLENFQMLDERNYNHLIPYMNQRYEHKRKYLKNPFTNNKFKVTKGEFAICPNNEKLEYIETRINKSKSGFKTFKDIYRTNKCSSCPYVMDCNKGKSTKTIHIDEIWMDKKIEIYDKFQIKENAELYKLRTFVEHNFAQMKHNRKTERFRNYGIKMNTGICTITAFAINILREYNAILSANILNCLQNIKKNMKSQLEISCSFY